MLQDIRKNAQGTIAKVIVGLIVISFSLFGIESILLGGGGSGIAEVNGEDITPQELQQSLNMQKRRMISMMGQDIDPAMLDDERLTPQVLDSLIGRKLLMQSARGMELEISEREIAALISGMEQFQVDGAFSPQLYKGALADAGYTPSSFKQVLREDMAVNQLQSGLAGSDFATASELGLNARVLSEQRDVRYLTIPLQAVSASESVSEDEINAYYEANKDSFRSSESVDLEYILLTPEDFYQPVDESEILAAYEQASQDFQYQPRNRVSHILFESGADAADRISKAQAQLAEGVEFADVAREFSDDIGSSGKGGDLGYSTGDAFPPAMERAIADLEPGSVSQPVETDAGTHLILVTERSAGEAPELGEMRAELERDIQAAEARVELVRIVESLRDLSFTADDLESPAAELALTVKRENGISRTHREGVFANESVLTAAFSDDVLVSGHNSEVIELAGDNFVVLRVRQHNPSEVQPLQLVRNDIESIIQQNNARLALEAEAERVVSSLRSGGTIEQLATTGSYEWQVELGIDRRSSSVPMDVLRRVFEMPAPAANDTVTDFTLTQSGDAVVIELARVNAGDIETLTDDERLQLQQQIRSEFSSLINNDFQRGLREGAEITVL